MISFSMEVKASGLKAKDVFDFMLNCTDEVYQKWWPGTHLAFHTKKRTPDNIGNRVHFDEYVGKRRLKFDGIVTNVIPGKRIVWQMIKIVRLPAWLILDVEDTPGGVRILHTMAAGYQGIGRLLDPVLKLYLSDEFERQLNQHAQTEFPMLAAILKSG
jgi:hypothetical protein